MSLKLKGGNILLAFGAVAISFAVAITSFAQTGSTTVTGTVSDQQGAVVAGATVRLINEKKAFSRSTVTSGSGAFAFPGVPPETYRIEIEASGFKKRVETNVIVLVDIPRSVNAVLEIGSVEEVVSVTSGELESIVNNQDASLGNNFVSRQIQELPLEGRNVADLLSLQPGVTQSGEVSGSRSDQANITLDGVDVNDQQLGTAFQPVIRVTPDSVDEFRVTTSNADSARGRSSGAQISLSTKSGTNQFRGAIYEYHRNTITTANDFFSNAAGRYVPSDFTVISGAATAGDERVPRPKLIRNLFGGRLGGPIVKDRFFFFYNYEGLREARQTPVTQIVPTASLAAGTVKWCSGLNAAGASVAGCGVVQQLTALQINTLTTNGSAGGSPVVDVNPAALGVLQSAATRYRGNDGTVGDGLNTIGFRFNANTPSENNTHTGRFDWNVTKSEAHKVSFGFTVQNDFFSGVQAFPDTPVFKTTSKPFRFYGAHSWTISNNMVNTVRYGFTRQSFSNDSDATGHTITFRGVYSPVNYVRAFFRQTDTQNIVDDFSWVKGNHTIQMGGNFRMVRNHRELEGPLFDTAVVNRSFFSGSGNVLTNPIIRTANPATPGVNYTISSSVILSTRDAMAAVLGRYSQYGLRSNFDAGGSPLAAGVPVIRDFATEEYDMYFQDAWRVRPNLSLTYGVRYGLSRPVYEKSGYQTAPTVSLQEYLNRRVAAAAAGQNYGDTTDEALIIDFAGPVNGKGNVYPWDKNNFQPNVSVAWSPNFKSGLMKKLFGANSASVLRGGFRITNDYFGQALAVNFDANNTIGFGQNLAISANTFNTSTNPGPLFTGFNQNIHLLPPPPGSTLPTRLTLPTQAPFDGQRRIEGSLDTNLVSPINYQWNVTYGRELPGKLYFETSYIGRIAKNLLASRDVMGPNNIKDPASGQTWYEAAGILENYRRLNTPVNSIPNIPFFENMFPAGSIDGLLFGAGLSNTRAAYGFMAISDRTTGCNGAPLFGCYDIGNDWTFLQDVLDRFIGRELFYQKQYGALSAYGTIASSNYHGATASVRQRFKGLTWDFNYTFSKSMDDASGVQSSGVYGAAFILNALSQRDNHSYSDFDTRHIINVNSIFEIPLGRGKAFFSNMNKYANAVFGGWQLSSIFRYNSGVPVTDGMVDIYGWPTNWNVRSYVTRLRNVQTSPTSNGVNGVPNLFQNPTDFYTRFRNAAPGETGDRNVIRYPGYVTLDMGLAKSFQMPWGENHKVQFRMDAFNISNTQRFTAADTIFGLDPYQDSPSPTFGNFGAIQGSPRVFQFALRYDF